MMGIKESWFNGSWNADASWCDQKAKLSHLYLLLSICHRIRTQANNINSYYSFTARVRTIQRNVTDTPDVS